MTQKRRRRTTLVFAGLVSFGYLYNRLVEALEKDGHDRGYMSLIVSGGTAITLIGVAPLIGIEATKQTFACFIASGLPMIWGSISRHCRARARVEAQLKREARDALTYDQERQT